MKKIEKTVDIPLLDEIPSETPKSTPRSFMSNLNDLKSGILMRRKSLWEEMPDREIRFNETQEHFKNNKVNTSKYTCLTFIPKNFIEQFSKLANIYFLIIGFLQLIPEISASLGVPVILFPLTVILIVTAFKDLFEDLKRKKSDAQENNRKTLILTSDGEFKPITWELLQVGNIVKIKENEYFPADIILLNSGDAKGICFIETKNLDGETNLKRKSVQKDLNYMKNLSDYEVKLIK